MKIENIITKLNKTNNYKIGEQYRKIGFTYLQKHEPINGTDEEIKQFVQQVQNFNTTLNQFNKTIAKKHNKIGLTRYWIHNTTLKNKIYKIYNLQYTKRRFELPQISIFLNEYEA